MGSFKTMLCAATVCFSMTAGATAFVGERSDFRDETVYFVMTTRFYDGDKTNNVVGWDHQNVQIANGDPDWRGDFKGLIEKLDYIKALGFTAVWITPVVQNCSGTDFHGYHAMDFSSVDLRYESRKQWGADEDVSFQDLIDAAHSKGMKVILDIVLNHTGNFGEARLAPLFKRDQNIRNQATPEGSLIPDESKLGANYWNNSGDRQYQIRFPYLKNSDGTNKDNHNYWHHVGTGWNWDYPSRWFGQIAGDCVDLNTENPAVSDYLVECYGKFIEMGVDGFRIDTTGHIARLTFNAAFIPEFIRLGELYKDKRPGGAPFYMFGECCARFSDVTYRNQPNLSSYFYTWESPADLLSQWNRDASFWDNIFIREGDDNGRYGNMALCEKEPSIKRESNNVFLQNGEWHEPDYSAASGFNVIDFPMHYNFNNASAAVNIAKSGDKYYNDASWNLVYVDSHDYCPGPNDGTRFNGGTAQWAENMSLMFTFRGIPCIYYGSEVEFKKGMKVDAGGTDNPVKDSGRAYFGEYLEGSVEASDFGEFTASGNVAKTLDGDLAHHVRRLNMIRAAVPALRKGQYSWDGCRADGGIAFRRAWRDSYALVAINGGATFTGIPEGTYTDIVTGKKYSGTSITVAAPKTKGQLRVLVKDWKGGKIGEDGKFIYESTPVAHGGNPSFADKPCPQFYTADDVIGRPAVLLSPAGGTFLTPTLTVKASLNDAAVAGSYTVGDTNSELISGETREITIGEGVPFDGKVTISWKATGEDGQTYSGSAVYTKIDPDAVHTWSFVYDPSETPSWTQPYAYFWDAGNNNKQYFGSWPGTKMQRAGDMWTISFSTKDIIRTPMIIFNNGQGHQTADLQAVNNSTYTFSGPKSGISDVSAATEIFIEGRELVATSDCCSSIVIYTPDGRSRTVALSPGETRITLLPGIYIIDGRKYAVR